MHVHCAAWYKGHRMTRDMQPQRDIDREREGEGEGEGEGERRRERKRGRRERGRERAGSSVVSIETLYYKTIH